MQANKRKLLLLGSFSTFAGQGIARLVRVHSTGALDTTFTPHSQFQSTQINGDQRSSIGNLYLRDECPENRPVGYVVRPQVEFVCLRN